MDDWRKELGLEGPLLEDPTLANYKTPADALQAFIETKSKLGRSVSIPSEDAGEEARAEFLAKIQKQAPELIVRPDGDDKEAFWRMAGVPEKPDEYNPPEEVGLDAQAIEKFREYAHAVGMTQEQFRKGLAQLDSTVRAQQEQAAEIAEADKAALDKAWGSAAKRQEAIVAEMVSRFQDPDHPVEGEINAAGKILIANMAKAFAQQSQAAGQPNDPAASLTPPEAREELNAIRKRLFDEGREMPRDEYKRLTGKMIHLQRQLSGAP